jgi:hypothetical protein
MLMEQLVVVGGIRQKSGLLGQGTEFASCRRKRNTIGPLTTDAGMEV